MSEEKLKPCYCGGRARIRTEIKDRRRTAKDKWYWIECQNKFSTRFECNNYTKKYDTLQKTIEVWTSWNIHSFESKQLQAEIETAKQEARLYRQLLRCMGDTDIDCVSDLPLDIKDWLAELDKITQGEKPLDVFGCEQCSPEDKFWKCQLCKVLTPKGGNKNE